MCALEAEYEMLGQIPYDHRNVEHRVNAMEYAHDIMALSSHDLPSLPPSSLTESQETNMAMESEINFADLIHTQF